MTTITGDDLIEPQHYATRGYPHELWTRLRREDPVHWCESAEIVPYWAITKHADICEISKQPDVFQSGNGIVPATKEVAERLARGERGPFDMMQTIITMDPPKHRKVRKVASPWFTSQALARVDGVVNASARRLVDHLYESQRNGEGTCDFVTDVAVPHPLHILSSILGIAEADEPKVLRLTQQLFAADDPEFKRTEENPEEAFRALGIEFLTFFGKIIAEKRAHPDGNLASVLANAELDGARMGDIETLGYYLITFTAGHDTTRNSMAGGMLALVQNPAERAKLRAAPQERVADAVEEIVRWTTPVNYMMRTAASDYELRGTKIRAGERVLLFYASANRDEEVFDEPFRFKIDRHPNPHLGFGIGEHFCLGSHLARRSQRALFSELIGRLDDVELLGEPEKLAASFVAGVKHLRLRYRLSPHKD
ncbi:MAG TPA: cytochrome P450 [Myxococcota bacterium]|nr:cytochrome P450 [Myxococcota bacterium]